MSISVNVEVPPRHSKQEWAKHACREYSGTIGYEAKFSFDVELDESDRAANKSGAPSLWVRQQGIGMHFFRDWAYDLCEQVTVHFDEFFSIGRNSGTTKEDKHYASTARFGLRCPTPCRQYGIVICSLTVVTCRDQTGAPYNPVEPGEDAQDYGCHAGTYEVTTYGPHGTTSRKSNLDECPDPNDPNRTVAPDAIQYQAIPEVDSVLTQYGSVSYTYNYAINHCVGSWSPLNRIRRPGSPGPLIPPPAAPPPATDEDSLFGPPGFRLLADGAIRNSYLFATLGESGRRSAQSPALRTPVRGGDVFGVPLAIPSPQSELVIASRRDVGGWLRDAQRPLRPTREP